MRRRQALAAWNFPKPALEWNFVVQIFIIEIVVQSEFVRAELRQFSCSSAPMHGLDSVLVASPFASFTGCTILEEYGGMPMRPAMSCWILRDTSLAPGRLQEANPGAKIFGFTLIRTLGFVGSDRRLLRARVDASAARELTFFVRNSET